MPYTTITSGTTITAAWANASVRDQTITPFASTAARDSAITAPVDGMLARITGDDTLCTYNGSAWVCITPVSASVATSEATTSTSYAALSTAGPAVTVETGTKALVILSATIAASGGGADIGYMGFAVSGATTLAESDTRALRASVSSSGFPWSMSRVVYYASLTAGSNTFTAKYKTSASTVGNAFADRTITVIGIP